MLGVLDALKGTIEKVLAAQPALTYREFSRSDSFGRQVSPSSSSEEQEEKV